MSERIKTAQAQKKIKDEKELVEQMLTSLENQLAAKNVLCQKLEEKERAWNESRNIFEQEIRFLNFKLQIVKSYFEGFGSR